MNLKRIFVNDDGTGLYAMVYDNQDIDEYERIFDDWYDSEYVREYLKQNEDQYLKTEYFVGATIDDIANKINKEADELDYLAEEHSYRVDGKKLEMLFKPLKDHEYKLPTFQHTKAKIDNRRYYPKPILRVYGLRIAENTFVVTGGAIKMTRTMGGHPDTLKELEKLEKAKQFLKDNGYNSEEDFKIFINE